MGAYGVVGNPDAMRGFADSMAADAEELRNACRLVRAKRRSLNGGGPKVSGWATALDLSISAFSSAADSLDQAVKLLRSSATVVENEIATRRRAAELAAAERDNCR